VGQVLAGNAAITLKFTDNDDNRKMFAFVGPDRH
jgi:hypothetical protein